MSQISELHLWITAARSKVKSLGAYQKQDFQSVLSYSLNFQSVQVYVQGMPDTYQLTIIIKSYKDFTRPKVNT